MPKVKFPRVSPSIDMTPMVDLAFLLVTFFMLTTKFRPEEPVTVSMPFSISNTKLPENNTTITVDSVGRVFFDMDGKDVRPRVLRYMADKYKVAMTPQDTQRFAVMGAFGIPMSQLPQYIEGDDAARKQINATAPGIPMDTIKDNELADWIFYSKSISWDFYALKISMHQNVKLPQFSIKADGRAKYKIIKQVIEICQKQGVQHFNLITSLKSKA
jgi:biopolymer transport protein ExbD